MNRVVMVLGIGRIDGDQRHVAPVLAASQGRGLCLFRFAQRGRRKRLRNFMGVNRDQADRLFGCQRAEPLLDLAGAKPETAGAHQIHADEIAVLGATGIGFGNVQFAAGLLLVDRNQPSAAAGQGAEDSEHTGLGVIDDLDDAPAIGAAVALVQLLDAQQRAIAHPCGRARLRTSGNMDADLRRLAVFDLIPLGGRRGQFAVAIASGDVGHHGRGQACGFAYFLAALGDHAFVGELAQDAFQFGAVGVLQAEFARDLAGSDFSRLRTDEGDDGVRAWKNLFALFCHFIRLPCQRSSSLPASRPLRVTFWRSPSPVRAPC